METSRFFRSSEESAPAFMESPPSSKKLASTGRDSLVASTCMQAEEPVSGACRSADADRHSDR